MIPLTDAGTQISDGGLDHLQVPWLLLSDTPPDGWDGRLRRPTKAVAKPCPNVGNGTTGPIGSRFLTAVDVFQS